jgi:hypothetical protein
MTYDPNNRRPRLEPLSPGATPPVDGGNREQSAANNHGHRRARHRSPTHPKEAVTCRSTNMPDLGPARRR